jgi:hypothetical protein
LARGELFALTPKPRHRALIFGGDDAEILRNPVKQFPSAYVSLVIVLRPNAYSSESPGTTWREVELLIIQHVPTRPEVQVTHSAKRGLIDVTVRLADQEPRR